MGIVTCFYVQILNLHKNSSDILTDEVNDNSDLQINYYYLNLVSC